MFFLKLNNDSGNEKAVFVKTFAFLFDISLSNILSCKWNLLEIIIEIN